MNKPQTIDLEKISDEELLSLRFRDLPIKLEGTPLQEHISQLYRELAAKNIEFHPQCYLADEWMCPDGEPVVGIAFFLAHPRLRKMELKMMLEAEGADKEECMRLLRHETGHAINYAYLLHKRKKWRKLFGPFHAEYGERYKYRPYSKRFVRHLEGWYAQYHPDEDFAETFAVWLDPESHWREKYKTWGALDKLEYVDRLMNNIVAKHPPKKPAGKKYWDIRKLKTPLAKYYKKKRELYGEEYADFHDFHLARIFPEDQTAPSRKRAYDFLKQHRKEILNYVALWTGEKKYIINGLLKDLVKRSKDLGLVVTQDEATSLIKTVVYVTTQAMNYLYTGEYKAKR